MYCTINININSLNIHDMNINRYRHLTATMFRMFYYIPLYLFGYSQSRGSIWRHWLWSSYI